jgi:hypothetical protein
MIVCKRAMNIVVRRATMNTPTQQPRTREEMIATLVHYNDSDLRGLLTLTSDTIDWLNSMVESETARYAALTDAELAAACEAL